MIITLDSPPPFLIMEDENGFEYSPQVGGILCAHPVVKGVPVFPSWLSQFDTHKLDELTCTYGCFGSPFSEEGVKEIIRVWPFEYMHGWRIEFDPGGIEESMEAFIPIIAVANADARLSYEDKEFYEWVHKRSGFLILRNCD